MSNGGIQDMVGTSVRDPVRIAATLRVVLARGCLLHAQAEGGARPFLTAVLGVEGGDLLLDVGPDAALNRVLGSGARLVVRTQLDGIALRFACGPCRMVEHDGRAAFRVPCPDSLSQLQRREFYRLEASPASPVFCRLAFDNDDAHRAPVTDLSAGGLGLRLPADDPRLSVGLELPACRLELPGTAPLAVALQIVRLAAAAAPAQPALLAGCQFQAPGAALQRSVNRYIMQLERERAAQARGVMPGFRAPAAQRAPAPPIASRRRQQTS